MEHPLLEVRKTVTVLFSDVKGSTALSERMDPERLRRVMTMYFDQARATLEWHGGTVEKFIGDAVMAVFGVPDAARGRCAAGAAGCRGAAAGNGRARATGWSTLTAHASKSASASTAARCSPEGRRARARSSAARSSSSPNGCRGSAAPGEILIGEETYRLARDAVRAEALEPLAFKGNKSRSWRTGSWRWSPVRRRSRDASTRRWSVARGSWSFWRARSRAPCTSGRVTCSRSSARPESESRRLVTEALAGIGDRATRTVRRKLPPLRRGNHVLAGAPDREAAHRDRRRRLSDRGARRSSRCSTASQMPRSSPRGLPS